jgi:TolB protein
VRFAAANQSGVAVPACALRWSSGNTAIVTVTNAPTSDSGGIAYAVAVGGPVTVQAQVPGSGKTQISALAVATVAANTPLYFLSGGSNTEDIFTIMSDGSGLTRITNNGWRDYAPRRSPDGTRLSFSSELYCGGCGWYPELYVANADGSNPTRLTFGLAPVLGTAWSPDGRRIVFDSPSGIWVIAPDGTGLKQIAAFPANVGDWSPDGTRILVQRLNPYAAVVVMNADGTGVQTLRTTGADVLGASWSPDGRRIAFGDLIDGNQDIWVMNADGTGAIRLTTDPAVDTRPVWSPDGQSIAFMSNRSGQWQIHVMRSDGSDVRQVTGGTITWAMNPSWR